MSLHSHLTQATFQACTHMPCITVAGKYLDVTQELPSTTGDSLCIDATTGRTVLWARSYGAHTVILALCNALALQPTKTRASCGKQAAVQVSWNKETSNKEARDYQQVVHSSSQFHTGACCGNGSQVSHHTFRWLPVDAGQLRPSTRDHGSSWLSNY